MSGWATAPAFKHDIAAAPAKRAQRMPASVNLSCGLRLREARGCEGDRCCKRQNIGQARNLDPLKNGQKLANKQPKTSQIPFLAFFYGGVYFIRASTLLGLSNVHLFKDKCECSFWRWYLGAQLSPPCNFGGDPLEKRLGK